MTRTSRTMHSYVSRFHRNHIDVAVYGYARWGQELCARTDIAAFLSDIYAQGGIGAVTQSIDGEFFVTIRDDQEKRTYLIADPMNNRPAYYALLPSGAVLTATTLNEIAEEYHETIGCAPRPDTLFLAASIANVVDRIEYTGRTPFLEIKRVPGGSFLTIDTNGSTPRVAVTSYFFPADSHPIAGDLSAVTDVLDGLLEKSLRAIAAYVPGKIALSLSGGLDSGLIAAYGSRVCRDRFLATTYRSERYRTVGEYGAARTNADLLGIPLTAHHMDSGNGITSLTPASIYRNGLPINRMTAFQELMTGYAAQSGCDVFLNGHGGDELFGLGHTPAYLVDLLRRGDGKRAWSDIVAYTKREGQSPLWLLQNTLRVTRDEFPRVPSWLSRATTLTGMFTAPPRAPRSIAARLALHPMELNLSEKFWNAGIAAREHGIIDLSPLRHRSITAFSYGIRQDILQSPDRYKPVLQALAGRYFPSVPFQIDRNGDYGWLIVDGIEREEPRFASYFGDDCRLVRYGIADDAIRSAVRGYLRDPGFESDWGKFGQSILLQQALMAEMWLRGYESAFAK